MQCAHGQSLFSAGQRLTLCGFFLCLFFARSVHADTSVTIAETTHMDFGTVAIPTGGSQYLVLSPTNSTENGTGAKLFGTSSRGVYTLKSTGSGSTSMTIDVMNISTGSASLTLDNFTGVYNGTAIASFPSQVLALPSTSGTPLYLGAKETVSSSISRGAVNPTFDILVTIN